MSTVRSARIVAIDALRGLVILLMLVDHVREFFYLDHPVADPMDLATTPPALVMTRLTAHLCAPIFVALTGLAAWLYADGRGGAGAASQFLLKRGAFLIALELTVINFAWGFDLTPSILYLQVIWVIGLAMIALAGLVHLPRVWVAAIGGAIVIGHNLLDPIAFAPGTVGHVPWAILHDRSVIDVTEGLRLRTSYPLLPWIGVIALGWSVGPWFKALDANARRARLVLIGVAMLSAFAILRAINGYGDPHPWRADQLPLAFLNVTKYPPSLDFLLLTLGLGALLLAALERVPARVTGLLAVFGSAPLFFYILHLYLIHALNRLVGAALGTDGLVSVASVWMIWAIAAAVAVPCWFACRRFAAIKRASGAVWMRYL